MKAYTIEALDVIPEFDLELLMSTSQETRIGGEAMEQLGDAWEAWTSQAKAHKITTGGESYLLAWLDAPVEDFVDEKWEQAPSDAFLFNALAQVMCMGIVHYLLPEVADVGCAASPAPTDALADALEELGVPYMAEGQPGLMRRYAVVTFYPFKGGCEVCALQSQCPKGSGQTSCSSDGPMSVVLPGHEQ